MRIEQVMTRNVVSVTPETSVKEVARLLVAYKISGMPVCDADGIVLGVISEADILRKEEGYAPALPRPVAWLVRRLDGELAKVEARTAADAMTAPALTVRPTQQTADVARLMVENRINRVPVVVAGRLVGIVSRADLVRAFTRTDEELEQEIREEVIFRTMLREPDEFDLEVRGGHVSISGHVAAEGDASILVRCIERVPGVVHVDAHLDWSDVGRPKRVAPSVWS